MLISKDIKFWSGTFCATVYIYILFLFFCDQFLQFVSEHVKRVEKEKEKKIKLSEIMREIKSILAWF